MPILGKEARRRVTEGKKTPQFAVHHDRPFITTASKGDLLHKSQSARNILSPFLLKTLVNKPKNTRNSTHQSVAKVALGDQGSVESLPFLIGSRELDNHVERLQSPEHTATCEWCSLKGK